jgi:hypothetical protein
MTAHIADEIERVFRARVPAASIHSIGPYAVVGMTLHAQSADYNARWNFNLLHNSRTWLSDWPSAISTRYGEPEYMESSALDSIKSAIVDRKFEDARVTFTCMPYAQIQAGEWIEKLADAYHVKAKGLFGR